MKKAEIYETSYILTKYLFIRYLPVLRSSKMFRENIIFPVDSLKWDFDKLVPLQNLTSLFVEISDSLKCGLKF